MVEGARLESVYTRKGIAGSNPALSAIWLFCTNFLGLYCPKINKRRAIHGYAVQFWSSLDKIGDVRYVKDNTIGLLNNNL